MSGGSIEAPYCIVIRTLFFFINKIFGVRLSGVLTFFLFSLTFSYFLTSQTTYEDENSEDKLLIRATVG